MAKLDPNKLVIHSDWRAVLGVWDWQIAASEATMRHDQIASPGEGDCGRGYPRTKSLSKAKSKQSGI
jgi:hypothetical protein